MSDTLEDIDTSQLDNVGRVKIQNKRNILDITEDCTRLVFDRLTLNQLIHLRAVCNAWNDIITDICEKKRSLLISFSKQSIEHYFEETRNLNIQDDPQFQLTKQHFLLVSPKIKHPNSSEALKRARDGSFSEQQNDPNLGIRFIVRLFPNIANFVCMLHCDRLFELSYILWKWSTNLNTLTVFNDAYDAFSGKLCKNGQQDFVKCFQQMNSLRRLHLLGISEQLNLPANKSIFGQLEEFTFDNIHLNFAPYFAQLNANNCTMLRVLAHLDSWDSTNLTDANPELTSKLTNLAINLDHYQNHISKHLAKFQNLLHLEITEHAYYLPIVDVLPQIVSLPKLKTFVLELKSFVLEAAIRPNRNYHDTFPIFHNTITELRLTDQYDESTFSQFSEYQLLAKIFPRVVNVQIYSNNLNIATFDAKFRPRFNEAFGERVDVTFYRTQKYDYYHVFGDE